MFHWLTRAGPAAVRIVDLRAPRRRHVQLARRWPDARIERRRVQIGDVVPQPVPQPQRRFAERRIRPIDRVETDAERRRSAGHIPPVRQRAVGDAPAGTQHGLVVEPVGRAEPRTERVGIGLRELAVAAARSVAFIDEPTGQPAGRGIRRRQADLAGAIEPLVALARRSPSAGRSRASACGSTRQLSCA